MTTNFFNFTSGTSFVASPLDQFSNHLSFGPDLLNNLLLDYLPLSGLFSYLIDLVDFTGLSELLSLAD